MKKNLICGLLLTLFLLPLQAQDGNGKREVVLSAGTNHSRFSEDIEGGEADCLLCWLFGAEVIFAQRGPLQFSAGVNQTGTGSKYKSGEEGGEGGSYSFENKETLNYLNFPVEARYEFGAGKIKPFVRGGGALGILLSAKSKTKSNFNGRENEDETDIKKQKKSTNLALVLGGGVSFPLGKFRGVAAVRYGLGLTNIVKDDKAPSAKTRDLSYTVGVGLPF